ncbi:MAG: thiamine biosynthesis protein ApbE [Opitutaceae bacterium]|nr:thiamine biosynthesis protein ApbE [Opitutaceae bacterium]
MKGLSKVYVSTLFLLSVSCSAPKGEYLVNGDTMGTFYTVQFWPEINATNQILNAEIQRVLNEFEKELSNWRPNSWINQFNAAPVDVPVPVPIHAYSVLKLSLELAERSDGFLDPTLSPLINLWGFGVTGKQPVPSQRAIDETLKRVGHNNLIFDRENKTLTKKHPGVELNCSAVAKGYAVDLVGLSLRKMGIENYLINIGGEVSAHGNRRDGSNWTVGLLKPSLDGRIKKSGESLALSNLALATSGQTHRTIIRDGKRYTHILNPKTGYPVSTNTASVTVVAQNCALADGLATLALLLDDDPFQVILQSYEDVEVIRMHWAEEGVASTK